MSGQDYLYIQLWGRFMGSSSTYIKEQVELARTTGAPSNAIYERDGVWETADTVTNPPARVALGLPPLKGNEPIVLERHGAEYVSPNEIRFSTAIGAIRWADRFSGNFSSVQIKPDLYHRSTGEPMTLRVIS